MTQASYPENWIPTLTPSADVYLDKGDTRTEVMGGGEKDTRGFRKGKGLKQRPCLS